MSNIADGRADDRRERSRADATRPDSARFWRGLQETHPKDVLIPDLEAIDHVKTHFPRLVDVALAGRRFLVRAVTHLAETGVRQFLDIGTGMPDLHGNNTHQVAQRINPACRIAYVDNSPVVLAHAETYLRSTPEGGTAYIDADLRDPEHVLREAGASLDLDEPVAVILMGVLGHISPLEEAHGIVRTLMAGVPSGSYLVHYDGTDTHEQLLAAERAYKESGATPYHVRSPQQIAAAFDGLDLLAPGVVPVTQWRPDAQETGAPDVDGWGGVGRKP